MDPTEIQAIIDSIKAELTALSATILAMSGKINQEYMEDTGQGRIRVLKVKLNELLDARKQLWNDLIYWQNQLTGNGTRTHVPAW
jgi:hypothetical protein